MSTTVHPQVTPPPSGVGSVTQFGSSTRTDPGAWVDGTLVIKEMARMNSGRIGVNCTVNLYGMSAVSGRACIAADHTTLCSEAMVTGEAYLHGAKFIVLAGSTRVTGNARIGCEQDSDDCDLVVTNAVLSWNADVADIRHVLTIGGVGSEGRTVTVYRAYRRLVAGGHYAGGTFDAVVSAGCYLGSIEALEERVTQPSLAWGIWDNEDQAIPWQEDYAMVCSLARQRRAEWRSLVPSEADHAYWADHWAGNQVQGGEW